MGSNSTRLSPRQKMINLMYIVLTAMLALNVSSDVLDGFTQVEDGLHRSNTNVTDRNTAIYRQLQEFTGQNPDKGQVWLDRATEVRTYTDQLCALVDSFKLAIVYQADGSKGDVRNIVNKDDLEAASVVMLNPASLEGSRLRQNVDTYRAFIADLMVDSVKKANINAALSTAPVPKKGIPGGEKWEEANFDSKPAIAAVTLLTKLQNDIRYAEGEALSMLLSAVDAGDVRVNELNAFVIPQSRGVMRGGKYAANIVLAAVDTTQRPVIYVDGKALSDDGLYE
ncbi:MAG: gliding motility protein GldM, partial [Muribaculaceae bacterium]|nr:gliding motility protein GldM [Muribaculaceae bacterium]